MVNRNNRGISIGKVAIFIFLIIFTHTSWSQTLESLQSSRPDQVFDPEIKTIELNRDGVELGDPVLVLGQENILTCSFDNLNTEYKDYKYTIIHCDPEWNETQGLTREDYMETFYYEEYIRDYETSYNTTTPFIHYWFSFPNDNIRPKISGNYKLIVYEEDPTEPAFTRSFFVSEQVLNITGRVARSANASLRPEVQQLFLNIKLNNTYIEDPYRNLQVVVTQNGRWDNEIRGIEPTLIMNNELQYNREGMIVFPGHNEFRFLDLKSFRYLAPKIKEITVSEGNYELMAVDRKPSRFLAYQYREDINGKFLIHTEEGTNAGTEADYARVKLFLPYDRPIAGGKLYVTGAFCNWQYLEENRAIYSPRRGGYIADIFLKQGYYNYTWAVVELGNLPADAGFIDGSFYDTQNLYTFYVYYRTPGDYHFRLLGLQVFDSAASY